MKSMKVCLVLICCLLNATLATAMETQNRALAERTFVKSFLQFDSVPSKESFAREYCEDSPKTCAEASIDKSGYVYSDCQKIENMAQDRCAAASIARSGYVYSDCLKLDSGGACAEASIEKSGYVYSDCIKVTNPRQDRCAAASVRKSGYVYSDCLNL